MTGRQAYREVPPAAELGAYLRAVWVQRVPADAEAYVHRTVPSGSVELTCRIGEAPRVSGPRTRATVDVLDPGAVVVGVRVRPEAAGTVLGVPAGELVDASIDLEALWGDPATELGEALATAGSPVGVTSRLQEQLGRRLTGRPDPVVAELVRRSMPGRSESVTAIASSLSISERQLRRRCRAAAGLAPKPLQRVLRFQGFLAMVQADLARGRAPAAAGLARSAADVGYADQAHLTRECARLAGLVPSAFLRETERQCGPEHDHGPSIVPLLRALRAA